MKFLGIVLLSVGSAIAYGILHDQVTARVCVEYFTLGHPPIFETTSPTLLAFGWGVVATWWMGVLLGIPLACCSRLGPAPALEARDQLKPIAVLLAAMAVTALIAGISGYAAARTGRLALIPPLADRIPAAKHPAFIADLWAHGASYAVGFFGGLGLCAASVIRRRRRAAR
jgi:hypothetical protein